MATERIYALFQDVADAERAIGALQDHGVTRDHIGVVARRPAEQDESGRVRTDYTRVSDAQVMHQGEPAVAYEARPGTLPPAALAPTVTPSSTADTAQNVDTVGKEGITFSTPQDAAAGAAVGGGIGLVTGLLAAAAALAIPGVGIVLSGGILAGALGAAAATTVAGAAVGGVAGYLTDMGMPQQAAQNVASRLTEGDYLVTVDADTSRYDDIRQILFKYNAAGVDVNVAAAGESVPPAAVTIPAEALTDVTPQFVDIAPQAAAPVPHSVPAPILVPDIMPPPFPPRVPADPALAQETEPMTASTGVVTPSVPVSPDAEAARIERAHTGEGQDKE